MLSNLSLLEVLQIGLGQKKKSIITNEIKRGVERKNNGYTKELGPLARLIGLGPIYLFTSGLIKYGDGV